MDIKRLDIHISFKSIWRGLREMKRKHGKVNYDLSFGRFKSFWFHAWTPVWHEGRGPYITIGFFFVRFIRGY
jgi:hypothetical protein